MQFEYRGYIGIIGRRNYYIKNKDGKYLRQALCDRKPEIEDVKKEIDRYIKYGGKSS